jgi:signal transduction histidine kinase/FixJ family two-component response regulator
MKVLCVDDKVENRHLLEILLGAAGYEVVTAASGLEAMQKLEAGGIDLIVSDLLPPPLDGFQFCRMVKSRSECEKIPFVFYPEKLADPRDPDLALDAGGARFVRKDEGVDRLLGVLRELLPGPGSGGDDLESLRRFNAELVSRFEQKISEVGGMTRALKEALESKDREMAERVRLESELRLVQKMESIGLLAGSVAHDFNNLLTVILNHVQFALDDAPDDSPIRQDLMEIKAAGDKAVDLTHRLLAFSRRPATSTVSMDLNQVIVGLEKVLRRLLGEGVEYVADLAADLSPVRGDPGQMEQVLVNLAVNAHEAMAEGGRFTLETSEVHIDEAYAAHHADIRPGDYVRLSVTDTGCGMDEQTKARLFEPFFTTKGKGKSGGFGLSTVYGVIRQIGGIIRVSSEPGKGTSFKIYLPRERSAAPAPVPARPALARVQGDEVILLVEDEEGLRKVAQRALESVGYTVLQASEGGEALLAASRHKGEIHLLVTDVVMPKMSGRALAQELTRQRPSLKVLFMSGYADNFVAQGDHLGRVDEFIGKPFTAAELALKVRKVLDGEKVVPPPTSEGAGEGDEGAWTLPREVAERLRRAVASARYEEVSAIVEELSGKTPGLAARLRDLAGFFDTEGILGLLGRVATGEGPHGS